VWVLPLIPYSAILCWFIATVDHSSTCANMLLLHVKFIVACLHWKKWFIDEILYNNNNNSKVMVLMLIIITICHSDTGGLMQSVIILYIMFIYNRGSQFLGTRSPRQLLLFGGFQYLWVLSIALASCHPSGIQNFNVALGFWKICAPLM